MIGNNLPNKLGTLKSSKINIAFEILFNQCAYSLRGFAKGILQVILKISCFKWKVKEHYVAKILRVIWKIFLDENNYKFNSYRFSYKFAFILFCSFVWIKSENLFFWKLSDNEKTLCFLYSSTDNILSAIPVSDWLIFCCENSILYQKKKWKR